jgi:hypothetical protein
VATMVRRLDGARSNQGGTAEITFVPERTKVFVL